MPTSVHYSGTTITGQTVHRGVQHPDVQTSSCKVSIADIVTAYLAEWPSLLFVRFFCGHNPFYQHHPHHSSKDVSRTVRSNTRPIWEIIACDIETSGRRDVRLQLRRHRAKSVILVDELSFFWHKISPSAPCLPWKQNHVHVL